MEAQDLISGRGPWRDPERRRAAPVGQPRHRLHRQVRAGRAPGGLLARGRGGDPRLRRGLRVTQPLVPLLRLAGGAGLEVRVGAQERDQAQEELHGQEEVKKQNEVQYIKTVFHTVLGMRQDEK